MTLQANILWEGSQFCHHSLAIANREYCSALGALNSIDLTLVPYEPDQFDAGDDPKLLKLKALDIRSKRLSPAAIKQRPTVWVRHQHPIHGQKPPLGAKLVIMLPWEYSVMPVETAARLEQADEVWTASNYSRNGFVRSGVSAEIVHVVPNGVNTARFTPIGDSLPLPTTKSQRFLFVGASILYRKGVDILLEAFCRAFTRQDDVCLVVKESGAKETYRGMTAAELIERHRGRANSPEILYLPEFLNELQMAQLYRACQVFVSSYRGEGFSLPTLEAMASGLPVIVPRGGATDDFVTGACGWFIDTHPVSVGHTIYDLPLAEEGFVLEPEIDHLVELLRAAYHQRASVIEKSAQAVQEAQGWTWQRAATRILERVDALCGTSTAQAGSTEGDDWI